MEGEAHVCLGSSALGLCITACWSAGTCGGGEAEARQHSQPDPAVPPGHTRMPENQRLETLSSLLQSEYVEQGELAGGTHSTMHPCPALLFLGPL